MAAYTSGDYVYINNMTDNPKINHVFFILNQRHEMYITSLLNITEEKFVSLPNLSVKKILKMDE